MPPPLNQLPPSTKKRKDWPWIGQALEPPHSMPNGKPWPKISIITPSLNQGHFIEETIRSVLLQNYPNLEYIIIDGGSSDNSVEIIKKYEPWLTYWVSEQDNGQSDAINKGLNICSGDIIAWLNSDDMYYKNTLMYAASKIHINKPCWLIGACDFFNNKNNATTIQNPPNEVNEDTFLYWSSHGFSQPSTFWNRKMLECSGTLDTSLHYVMDVDLWWRMLHYAKPITSTEVFSRYRIHDETKTLKNITKSNQELSRFIYYNLIENTNNPISNFNKIFLRTIELQTTIDRIKSHFIIGRIIRIWGTYLNIFFKNICRK